MLKEISNEIQAAFRNNRNGVTQLLVINVAVFLLIGTGHVFSLFTNGGSQAIDGFVLDYFGLSSQPIRALITPWTFLTYSIVHLSLFHFLFNMMGLYIFGQILQDFLGPRKILNFYFLGAISGGIFFMILYGLVSLTSLPPQSSILFGASGSIYGIICGAAFLVPNYSVNMMFLGPVRLKYIAIGFVLISFLQIPNGNPGGNFAHLGGALGGILYLKYLQGGFRFRFQTRRKSGAEAKIISLDSRNRKLSEEEELNLLLDKISEKGIQSLSREERNRLEQLSKPTQGHE